MARRSRRHTQKRSYRKRFVLAMEGTKTEPQYFRMLERTASGVTIDPVRGKKSSAPRYVLDRMQKHLEQKPLRRNDEAWLIIDRDDWTKRDILALHTWADENPDHHLAISHPCFEYWLLLHFEPGTGLAHPKDCTRRLCEYLPNFSERGKDIQPHEFPIENIHTAIERGRQRDRQLSEEQRAHSYRTDVYKLVEKLLETTE